MFSDLGILMLLASLDKLINEISKNRNASSKIMSFRLTSCYDFSFVGCKNHLTCIPRACNDQDYVSISVPARFYWLQESGTHKCLFFFFFFFFFGKAMASSDSWSRCDPQPLIPRNENGGTNGKHHEQALSPYVCVCDERAVECKIECFDLLLKK